MPLPSSNSLKAVALLCALALLLGALPSVGALESTGTWIFPHDHQADVLNGSFLDSFYAGANTSAWVQDSFFADSLADSASLRVDLYNPTESDFTNVQVFAAISDISLFTSIGFAGGDGGEVSALASDLGGGTPFLADGSTLEGHGVYPAYFTSYSVGKVGATESAIVTVWVNVTGNFSGGLIVHLDYAALDAAGAVNTGPFTADMNILETNQGAPTPTCQDAALSLDAREIASADPTTAAVEYSWQMPATPATTASHLVLSLPLPANATLRSAQGGTIAGGVLTFDLGSASPGDTGNVTLNFTQLDVLINTSYTLTATLSWQSCEGHAGSSSPSVSLGTSLAVVGHPRDRQEWMDTFKRAARAGGHRDHDHGDDQDEQGDHQGDHGDQEDADGQGGHHSQDARHAPMENLTLLLQRVALASSVFTYGPWNGTLPTGGADEGWIDIAHFRSAADALDGHGKSPKRVGKLEGELLALWLNVASGRVGLNATLKVNPQPRDHGKSMFELRTGLHAPDAAFDTPAEILALAERAMLDWKDGHGPSSLDVRVATALCESVNEQWLVPA